MLAPAASRIFDLQRPTAMPVEKQVKSILNKTRKRDPWFLDDYTVNPYIGCSFNCLYCYIRGSRYGIHMEKKLGIKTNAPQLLDKQLAIRAGKGEYGFIVLASATDPYLQFEEEYRISQQILEVILKHRFPVHVITKSNLVERDFELLREIDRKAILPTDLENKIEHGALLTFSFSTIDDGIAAIFEPGATPPSVRISTVERALKANIHSGVSLMPLLPFITDTSAHLEKMFKTFARINVRYLMPATLTLFGNQPSDSKVMMLRAIEKHYPELLSKYHQYFESGYQMPEYYQRAFKAKMGELGEQYKLPNLILQ